MTIHSTDKNGFGRVVLFVALANLSYFGMEFFVALTIGSVSLFADSIDFLEDASINLLILMALGWNARRRANVGMVLAAFLLVPGLATLVMAGLKLVAPSVPSSASLTITGLGALAVNVTCAFLLAAHRKRGGSLICAAFLSARNDALANVAIVAGGVVTAWTVSIWPDLVVGLGIAALNAGAAREVYNLARQERLAAVPEIEVA